MSFNLGEGSKLPLKVVEIVEGVDLDYTIESSVELPVKLVESVVGILEGDPMDEDLVEASMELAMFVYSTTTAMVLVWDWNY